MLRDIDTALLRAFISVVDTGSVTAAARLLNRTQAAVSQQIKRLEELLRQELFAREHRKLTLTLAGERLVGPATRLVSLNDEIWGRMTTPEFDGEVRLGVPTDIVPTYIPAILRRFNQAWPQVRVSLTLGNSFNLLDAFERGDVDLVLTTDREQPRNAETLRIDRLVFVGAPNGRAFLKSPLPLVIGGRSCRFRPVVLDALRHAKREWRLVLEASNQVAQEAAVTADIAVSAALSDSVPASLTVLGPEAGLPELPEFMINLCAPTAGSNPIADELARFVRSELAMRFAPQRPPADRSRRRTAAA